MINLKSSKNIEFNSGVISFLLEDFDFIGIVRLLYHIKQ